MELKKKGGGSGSLWKKKCTKSLLNLEENVSKPSEETKTWGEKM